MGNKYKRRKRTAIKNNGDDIDRFEVYERDNWICGICGEETLKPRARHTDQRPRRATLDHIIPLGKGGEHTYENVQCAHKECNQKKGDSLPCEIEKTKSK